MKLKTKILNSSFVFLSTTAVVVPLATTVSCSDRISSGYDFGLASKAINSLNYVRFKDTSQIIPSMVEGIFKLGTANKIVQSNLTFPKMEYRIAVDDSENGAQLSTRYYDMKDNSGILPGTAISSIDGNPIVGLYDSETSNSAKAVGIQLGNKHKWSNGDEVSAQDYIDTIKYILDVNTGSQFIIDVQESGIKNAIKVVEAQNDYIKKFGVPYQDPFGYDGWESQNPNDEDAVKNIKYAALSLGVFTSRDYKLLEAGVRNNKEAYDGKSIDDFHNDISWYGSGGSSAGDDFSVAQVVDDAHLLFIQFEDSQPQSYGGIITQLISKNWFLPTNRAFVEKTGGIQKFGIDKEHFLWNSAFYPDELFLGPSGYIGLKKDPLYYNSARTISNTVKIYFQSDPMVLASMFEDGYISQVQIPATHQLKFWSDLSKRPFMKKQNGFGTQALALNLDKTKGNEALQDANLRKALAYAMDRNALTKVANEEASFPVTTWTAFGNIHDNFGIPIETSFDGQTFVPFDGAKDKDGNDANLPIQSYTYTNHNAKGNQFERVDRTDIGFNVEYAKHFLEEYKKSHPNQGSVTLNYVYDGSNAINKNIGIYIQSQLKSIFNGYLNIEIKGLPSNVFESAKDSGDFDLIFYNFDSYGTQKDSYIKRFFTSDKIEPDKQKNTGFKENPSGGFTYDEWFKSLSPQQEADIKTRLGYDKPTKLKGLDGQPHDFYIWDKLKSLSTPRTGESSTDYRKRLQNFFMTGIENKDSYYDYTKDPNYNSSDHNQDPAWNQIRLITEIVIGFEKIIREAMPVISLMEVDTTWTASTIAGVDNLGSFQLQTAYDIHNKPASLPGIEAIA